MSPQAFEQIEKESDSLTALLFPCFLPGLLDVRWHRLPSRDQALDVCVIRFDVADFSSTAFSANNIHCPVSVASSIKKRQAEFFFGRLAARLALNRLDSAWRCETILTGASREPIWPTGIVGSISHNNFLAAAVTLNQEDAVGIGIDIETIVTDEQKEEMLDIVISLTELDYLRTWDSVLPLPILLTLVFSAKESFYKGAFSAIGRFFDFSAAQVSHIDIKNGTISLVLTEDLSTLFHRNSTWFVNFTFLQDNTVLTNFMR